MPLTLRVGDMGPRLQRISAEIAKFLAVGGFATLVALIIFNALVHGFFGDPAGPMNDLPLIAYASRLVRPVGGCRTSSSTP
jgi:hypothetical protein